VYPEPLQAAIDAAPDPDMAGTAVARVLSAGGDPALLAAPAVASIVVPLLGFSSAAGDLLAADPSEIATLAVSDPNTREQLSIELATDIAWRGAADGLRRFRRRATSRLAARDLAGAPVDEVVAELSILAEVCLEVAVREVAPDMRLAVIGLGKLGGSELNYASDVDVLFIHDVDVSGEAAQAAAARVIALLAEPTTEGVAFRVDVTLRPDGRDGPLSLSLEATLDYYEHRSATWERQAMLKARPVAGDPWLGASFVDGMTPFVYPSEMAPAAIEDVRRNKVRLEEYVRRRGKELIEVKRGRGGIRDVEFAVQLLQIVHGRRDPLLRERGTLPALSMLAAEGYIAEADAEELADAYRFLRAVEHRLQIVRDLQTHDLPADPHARRVLARSLGLAGETELAAEYERTTGSVRSIHERLFYRPLLEAFAGGVAPSPGGDRIATEELLAGLGFASPARSYAVLARLVDPATRMGKVLAHLFPVMAPVLALSPEPDTALVRLERIAESVGQRATPADALAADPRAAERLAHVAASSSFGTDLLVADPDRVQALSSVEGRQRDRVNGGSDGAVPATDPSGALVATVARMAAGELTPRDAGAELTAIGERVVREAVEAAAPEVPLAVIGMGKLGAREMNIASDLDIVFVHEGEGPDDLRLASEAAERVLEGIRAAGWQPDVDLRPEGRNGPIVRSLASYMGYWDRFAETWELQALLRARAVMTTRAGAAGGDGPDLGARFEAEAALRAYPAGGLTPARLTEIRSMRERM
jgi:glutamate-ammonia-ligase adenylyltransferase